jgi:DNA-binding PadR family transcriptional regulator
MKLEYFILGILKLRPSTGYDIKKFLDTEGRFARARTPLSQIYTTLKRMTEQGWVIFVEKQRQGKPDIKIYHNTEQGEEEFLAYLHSPIEHAFRFRENDVMLRAMYAFLVEPEVILEQLQAELDFRQKQIAKFRSRDRTVLSDTLSEEQLAYAQELGDMLHRFGARAIDDYVQSLEEMIAYFTNKKES